MVSTITMLVMAICVLVSVAVPVIPLFMIRKRSSKIETGLSGAVGYGFLGYIWQYLFYMFVGAFIAGELARRGGAFQTAVMNILLTFVSTAFTALSLYWGIYLTNQKQISLYRSAAVGIGFSLGKIAIDLVYPYVYSMYFAFQINAGTFQADEDMRLSILNTSIGSLLTGTYKCLLMFVIIFAITLIMGHYYIEKNRKMTWLSVIASYEVIMLINILLRFLLKNSVFFDVSLMVVFTVFALAAGAILYNWFCNGEVEVNPLAAVRSLKGKK